MDILNEAQTSHKAGAIIAAAAMVYIVIDTMAWLSLPIGKKEQGRSDFCNFVNTYLKADSSQTYQYFGKDVYAARCAVLHKFATLSELHLERPFPKKFGYLDNGPHCTNGIDLVLISVAVLLRDFSRALEHFVTAMQNDTELKSRVDSRITELLNSSPL